MRIPEQKIEEIRSTASIVDVVSEFVQLRKRGKNYVGLCPFHTEKTPSFTVSEEKQIFHCFGCHTGGNVFKFLMEYQKISFVESVQEIAEQLGITIEVEQAEYSAQQSEQEILYDINTEAAKYFSNNLLNDDEGEYARKYLQDRNIKSQTMRSFGLGYSLKGWENFINFAKSRSIDIDKCVQLGLIGKNAEGKLFDKLPGRLIFPIFSPNGRVIAFAGRVLDENEKSAKYLNSPESIIYIKGRILYGLSHAKDDIRRLDKAIIVEGYMDLIALYQHGIKNVVAVSGTALTDDQIQLLSRYTKNVVLLFDADTAGIKASMRSIEILLKRNFEIKIVSLPKGEDPDSYVNKFGRDDFEELVKKAENFLEYETKYYESEGKFNDPSTAAEAIRELMKPVALIDDELKRSLLIKSIAKKFNLREKLLEGELAKQLKQTAKFASNEKRLKDRQKQNEEAIPGFLEAGQVSPFVYNLEKEILKFIYDGDIELIRMIFNYIKPDDLEVDIHSELAEIAYEEYQTNKNISALTLISKINDEETEKYLREISIEKYAVSTNWEDRFPGITEEVINKRVVKDIIAKLSSEKIEQEIQANHRELELTEDETKWIDLMKANKTLEEKKKKIREELGND